MEAQQALARELIFEGANTVCKQAIAPLCSGELHDWLMACKDLDQNAQLMASTLANAFTDALAITPHTSCFNCKGQGHFAKDWPQKINLPHKPNSPTTCPRCHRGYHWAKDCCSKTDVEGKQLKPLNFKRGNSQPHTKGNLPMSLQKPYCVGYPNHQG